MRRLAGQTGSGQSDATGDGYTEVLSLLLGYKSTTGSVILKISTVTDAQVNCRAAKVLCKCLLLLSSYKQPGEECGPGWLLNEEPGGSRRLRNMDEC
jgi:hypothetical protein